MNRRRLSLYWISDENAQRSEGSTLGINLNPKWGLKPTLECKHEGAALSGSRAARFWRRVKQTPWVKPSANLPVV